MTNVHERYSEIGADVTKDMKQQAWGEEELNSPE